MVRLYLFLITFFLTLSCAATSPTSTATTQSKPVTFTHAPLKHEDMALQLEDIKWNAFDAKILIRAKLEKKLILIFIYSKEDCGACLKMKNTTFKDPDIIKFINKYFIATAVDGTENKEVNNALNEQKIFPSTVFLGPDGMYLVSFNGYAPAKNYKELLAYMLAAAKESGLSPN